MRARIHSWKAAGGTESEPKISVEMEKSENIWWKWIATIPDAICNKFVKAGGGSEMLINVSTAAVLHDWHIFCGDDSSDKIPVKNEKNAKQLFEFHRAHFFVRLQVCSQKSIITTPLGAFG